MSAGQQPVEYIGIYIVGYTTKPCMSKFKKVDALYFSVHFEII